MSRSVAAIAAVLAVWASAPQAGHAQAPQEAPALDRTLEELPQVKREGAQVDRFSGKLVLVLLDDKDHPSIKGGRSLWGVEKPLSYRPNGTTDEITVPPGFVTDLASIPRWAWSVLPPDGPWVKAAVIHDFLYQTKGTGVWKGHPSGNSRPQPYTRAESDGILREAMEDRGVGPTARNIIWAAVRVGGSGGWGS
ncbi:MAG TPA: DUF1353 domain-containing protein [Phenylobacterium sp.]|jgi:hypothetical protein|nr:DUF1353 domain-containing protein [Phenylobacterium sp.]